MLEPLFLAVMQYRYHIYRLYNNGQITAILLLYTVIIYHLYKVFFSLSELFFLFSFSSKFSEIEADSIIYDQLELYIEGQGIHKYSNIVNIKIYK